MMIFMKTKLTKQDVNGILRYMYPNEEILWEGGCSCSVGGFFTGTENGCYYAKTPGPKVTIWTAYPQWKMAMHNNPLNEDKTQGFVEVYRMFVIGKHALDNYPVTDKVKNNVSIFGIKPYESSINEGNYHNLHMELDLNYFDIAYLGYAIKSIEDTEKEIMGEGFLTQADEEIEHLHSENRWRKDMNNKKTNF
jgi:hypothetical protein